MNELFKEKLLIILFVCFFSSTTSLNNMDDNSTMECSSLPIIEENENFLSTIMMSAEFNDKVATREEEKEKKDKTQEENNCSLVDKNNSVLLNLDFDQSQSSEMIISTLMDNLLTQIEPNRNSPQIVIKKDKQGDSKQTTRTLRSHARGKLITNFNDNRRVSNRRRIFEKKFSFDINEKPQRKKTISERSNNNNETSSNSDDQTIENNSTKIFTLKTSIIDRITANEDDASDDDSHSPIITKQTPIHSDINSLPPNKRRLCERNAGLLNSTEETTITRDIPTNGIKQFLEIRQQVKYSIQYMK
jgi:hypothetical protein